MGIFSMAMGADYSFELISIETYGPQCIGLNNFFLGSVDRIIVGRRRFCIYSSSNLVEGAIPAPPGSDGPVLDTFDFN
jgi:hypothetical protein